MAFNLFLLLVVGFVAFLFFRQLRFSIAAQRLARALDEEGELDRSSLPRDSKGKVTPEAAAEQLARCQAETEAEPNEWRACYKLGIAYGDAGDPQAARAAVRRAIKLASRPAP